jgi:hypothetical protein
LLRTMAGGQRGMGKGFGRDVCSSSLINPTA